MPPDECGLACGLEQLGAAAAEVLQHGAQLAPDDSVDQHRFATATETASATATATSFLVHLSFTDPESLEPDGSSMDDAAADGALGGDADSGIAIAFTPSADEILRAVCVAFEVQSFGSTVAMNLI